MNCFRAVQNEEFLLSNFQVFCGHFCRDPKSLLQPVSTSTMENGQVATYADFPMIEGALLDSIKKSATLFLRGKAPRMKNLILSTLPHARAWSIEHACMRCFALWVGVSCLRKCECPRVKRVESLKHSKTLQIERFFDTLSTWTPP